MDDTMYTLSLSGGGLTVDREINEQTALAILNLVLRGGVSASTPETPRGGPAAGEQAGFDRAASRSDSGNSREVALSVGEFIAEVSAQRNPDKIVAIGAFLQRQGTTEFTAADIKPMFQQAGEPTPGNFMRDWRWAQSAKWIAPVIGKDKSFFVTRAGHEAVDAHFSPEIRKRTAEPISKKARKKSGGSE